MLKREVSLYYFAFSQGHPPPPPPTHHNTHTFSFVQECNFTGMLGLEVLGMGRVERKQKGTIWGRWLPLHCLDIDSALPRWRFCFF